MSKKAYRGKDFEVYFDSEKCIHSGICVKGMPEVFDLKKRPWINTDGAPTDKIAAHIDTCPSGALSYRYLSSPST
ncbi:(4Fe-4S)-binding protein [Paenibacillus spongiae]|uniref:(4Fe-4S)-binding protein n=1 Tax=Paenibacillus spongiae TaxID=2909671 RepID=A0ABY5S985_9BACL|nr:(4Fe-4S)-binding protein [Paenibacillus spongiae]UVI30487.1 (4Fe-4S)-binding protein [Paenibacillus spongiae]